MYRETTREYQNELLPNDDNEQHTAQKANNEHIFFYTTTIQLWSRYGFSWRICIKYAGNKETVSI